MILGIKNIILFCSLMLYASIQVQTVVDYDGNVYDSVYGALYNGYTVNETNEICPSGWHVSKNEEWQAAEVHYRAVTLQPAYCLPLSFMPAYEFQVVYFFMMNYLE